MNYSFCIWNYKNIYQVTGHLVFDFEISSKKTNYILQVQIHSLYSSQRNKLFAGDEFLAYSIPHFLRALIRCFSAVLWQKHVFLAIFLTKFVMLNYLLFLIITEIPGIFTLTMKNKKKALYITTENSIKLICVVKIYKIQFNNVHTILCNFVQTC